MNFYVYLHIRKTDGKIFYVGKGRGDRAESYRSRSKHWRAVVDKHGLICLIVANNLSEPQAFETERMLIATFGRQNLCNHTDGGDGTSGFRPTAETRAKMSAAHSGRKHSAESRAKIARAHVGMTYGPETKAKLSAHAKTRRLSQETRSKIGAYHRGNTYCLIKTQYIFWHPIHGKYVATPREFFLTIGEHPTKLIKGKKPHIKKWICVGSI